MTNENLLSSSISYDFVKREEGRGTDTDDRGVLLAEALVCAEFSRLRTMASDVGHEVETTAVDSGAVELGDLYCQQAKFLVWHSMISGEDRPQNCTTQLYRHTIDPEVERLLHSTTCMVHLQD